MKRLLLWLTTAALGAAATLMTSFGLVVVVLFLSLAVPLIVRGDRATAASGLLTGFGGFWSILLSRQAASGGTLQDAQYWTAVGIVPLVVGCTVLLVIALREFTRSRTERNS